MMKLDPIKEEPKDFVDIEREMIRLFKEEFYLPLAREVGFDISVLKNSSHDLASAIASGRITFYDGKFKGKFSATISRELRGMGAKWDRKQGCWKIPLGDLPKDIAKAIDGAESKFQKLLSRIEKRISDFSSEKFSQLFKLSKMFSAVLGRVERAVQKSVYGVTIVPRTSPESRALIADEYEQNMQKYIKDWTEEEIVRLRKGINKSVMAGQRYESIVEKIQDSYGVSASKAKFLARQETGLMTAKFKQARYTEGGVTEYEWRTVVGSPNHPVRPMHKALEGKTFKWNDPPVTSVTGQKNNPGEDFNCRCFAVPIVRFK